MKRGLLFATLMLSIPALAQTVSGTVSNRLSGLPIVDATVFLRTADNKRNVAQTSTDSVGRFLFDGVKKGDYSLLTGYPKDFNYVMDTSITLHVDQNVSIGLSVERPLEYDRHPKGNGSFAAPGLETRPEEYHLEFYQASSASVIYLVTRARSATEEGGYFIKTVESSAGVREVAYYGLNNLLYYDTATTFGPGGAMSIGAIHIKFIDEANGFLYGFGMVYDYYPFFYRTADGGKTWRPIKLNTGQLNKYSLHMFDSSRGIVLSHSGGDNKYTYYLTADGGITWQPRTRSPLRPATPNRQHSFLHRPQSTT